MNTKQIAVSAVVITSFVAYSAYQRFFGISNPIINSANSPTSIDQTQQNSASPTTAVATDLPTAQPAASVSPTKVPAPTSQPSPTPKSTSMYKDGSFTGDPADLNWGTIQVQAKISNGKLTDVKFLQYPNDRGHSIEVNNYADPILAQEAIAAQSANVDAVSGATESSQAFVQSLQSALAQAKN